MGGERGTHDVLDARTEGLANEDAEEDADEDLTLDHHVGGVLG